MLDLQHMLTNAKNQIITRVYDGNFISMSGEYVMYDRAPTETSLTVGYCWKTPFTIKNYKPK